MIAKYFFKVWEDFSPGFFQLKAPKRALDSLNYAILGLLQKIFTKQI